MNTVFLLLGGNLGDVRTTFRQARELINAGPGLIRKDSSLTAASPGALKPSPYSSTRCWKWKPPWILPISCMPCSPSKPPWDEPGKRE